MTPQLSNIFTPEPAGGRRARVAWAPRAADYDDGSDGVAPQHRTKIQRAADYDDQSHDQSQSEQIQDLFKKSDAVFTQIKKSQRTPSAMRESIEPATYAMAADDLLIGTELLLQSRIDKLEYESIQDSSVNNKAAIEDIKHDQAFLLAMKNGVNNVNATKKDMDELTAYARKLRHLHSDSESPIDKANRLINMATRATASSSSPSIAQLEDLAAQIGEFIDDEYYEPGGRDLDAMLEDALRAIKLKRSQIKHPH